MELMNDRREEFKNLLWQQGRLLDTKQTLKWPNELRSIADSHEKKLCFVNFKSSDQGCGRTFVYKYDSVEECEHQVQRHNLLIE